MSADYVAALETLVQELADFQSPDMEHGECAWNWECGWGGLQFDGHVAECPVTQARVLLRTQTEA